MSRCALGLGALLAASAPPRVTGCDAAPHLACVAWAVVPATAIWIQRPQRGC